MLYTVWMMSTIRRSVLLVLWSCIWSLVTSVVEYCGKELFWVVLSGKGVKGCCPDEWDVFIL